MTDNQLRLLCLVLGVTFSLAVWWALFTWLFRMIGKA